MGSDKVKNLSRLSFLKNTGIVAAGLTFLPDMLSAELKDSLLGRQMTGDGILDYQIIIPAQANAIEKEAALALQKYLSKLSVKTVPVSEEGKSVVKNGIYLGETEYAKAGQINFTQLPEAGFIRKVEGNNIIIAGGAKRGLLFGVFDLLEGLGFRKYSPEIATSPKAKTFHPPRAEKLVEPKIKYRTTSYSQMADQEYSDWHKLSSRDDWGLFVHTFNTLVPQQEYAKTHPEYYSLIDGVRRPGTQLCLSNPEVLRLLVASLKNKIKEKPTASYWSVSQDDNDRYCQCAGCKALNEKYGNVPSGSIIYFVNQVAREIPDKIISTLAYWYSRKAPKNIEIEPNVNIMLCNIESSRQAPVYVTDPAFSQDLKDWGALSKDIIIWDYNIQFTNYISPFPNLHTLKPNIKFYTDNRVNALFMQANNEAAAEMALLRSYLISKLMWDPDADDKAIINEFLNGYFEAAAPFIRQYIESMQESLVKSGMVLSIFGDPIHAKNTYLSAAMMQQYKQLFDKAENAVASTPELLKRVKTARLPLMYAEIQIGRTEINTERSMFRKDSNERVLPKPEFKNLVNNFADGCTLNKVKLVRERSGTPEHYRTSYMRVFNNMEGISTAISFRKKIIPVSKANPKSKALESLTDGIFASYESWQEADQNWVYCTAEHMGFILDLGEVMPVNSVNMDFLNPQAQPDWHLFALPKHVIYSLSSDGKEYSEDITISNPHNPNPLENPGIIKISYLPFLAELTADTRARYIKVHAESLLKTPSWHIRSGQPLSIYTDQIVVK
ncbi:MAG: DUF4838 domain-containing protein [Daejeonella sp.]|uniref:DUF4838 domain-containing protein n=1 Tax=Daejeonella sp. TaxID=2805397 RepID=UPI0027354AE2|nr:DUF4838 domain-containing protein [Daejeonella sp.]MDP3468618.1 DUF4838 domain-containing protein [Daejeonella sp.]